MYDITHRAVQALEDLWQDKDSWATFKLIDGPFGDKIELESWSWSPDSNANYGQFLDALPDALPRFAFYRKWN